MSIKSAVRNWIVKSLYDLFPELKNREHVYTSLLTDVNQVTRQRPNHSHQSSAWVYKSVEMWERLTSGLRLQLVHVDDGKPVRRHVLNGFLLGLNPTYPNSDLWRRWARSMALYGEAIFEVRYNGSRLDSFWCLNPEEFGVVPSATRRQHYLVDGYLVEKPGVYSYKLSTSEVIHWKFWNPLLPYRGLAPLSAVRNTVVNDQLAVAWQHFFFKNFAMPGVALVSKSGMTLSERQAMEKAFAERFGMTTEDWGIYKPIVLEEGITDIKTFSSPPKDIAWLDQRNLNAEEIAAVFGIAPEMMGFRVGKFDNYDVAEQIVWTLTMLPLLAFRDDWLTHFLQRIGQITILERVQTDLSKVYALRRVLDPLFRQGNYLFSWGAPFAKINEYFDLGFPRFEGDEISNPFGSNISVSPEGIVSPASSVSSVPSDGEKSFLDFTRERENGRASKIFAGNGRSFSFQE